VPTGNLDGKNAAAATASLDFYVILFFDEQLTVACKVSSVCGNGVVAPFPSSSSSSSFLLLLCRLSMFRKAKRCDDLFHALYLITLTIQWKISY
jgi:hypothetical protein